MVKCSSSTSKKMSKLLPVVLMGVGLSAAVSLPAVANDVLYHGNFCTPNKSAINTIERSQWGVYNTSNGSIATVECPFDLPFNGSLVVNNVWATVYDRDPNADVTCTLTGVDMAGNTLWSRTSSSSGSGETHQFLSFSPSSTTLGTMNMICSIPPATSSGVSHVTTYRVITTP